MTGIGTIDDYALPEASAIPASVATWRVDPHRAVLLVHDMQKYFVRTLPPRLRRAVLANCVSLADWATGEGVPVLYTAQPGSMTREQRGLLRDIWGPGMSVELHDREVVDELKPSSLGVVLTKWRYSAFFNSDLLTRLTELGRDQLLLCGVYAHLGVLVTAIDAYSHDIEPFLIADAVADFSAEDHQMAMQYAAARCAVVSTTAGVVS